MQLLSALTTVQWCCSEPCSALHVEAFSAQAVKMLHDAEQKIAPLQIAAALLNKTVQRSSDAITQSNQSLSADLAHLQIDVKGNAASITSNTNAPAALKTSITSNTNALAALKITASENGPGLKDAKMIQKDWDGHGEESIRILRTGLRYRWQYRCPWTKSGQRVSVW